MAIFKSNRDFYFSQAERRPATGTSIHRLVVVRASSYDEAECILVEQWRIKNRYPKGWDLELLELSKREYQAMVKMCNEVPA